ncbi:hypothetical protein G6F37_009054 [Rhizopus arrhizus]|nr:hypothetical protein G6F38_009104 [Rhizopus arrhizus]KAG1154874.1 hypothetical protein G6F37_009054 [Rhizopus arrhizus]
MLALRSSQWWREEGERSDAYFYRCLCQRQQQQSISSIRTDTEIVVTETLYIIETTQEYYEQLYSSDPINEQTVSDLLSPAPDSAFISPDVHSSLLNYWTVDEINTSNAHPPRVALEQMGSHVSYWD